MLTKKECTCSVCQGVSKESQVDWLVCRIYTICWHEDFTLGIYNTWREIIHTKSRLH